MKKWSLGLGVLALSCGFLFLVSMQERAGADVTPEKGMIIGEVVELTAYAMIGSDSEDYLKTAMSRAEHGFPVAVIEEDTGKLWIPAYRHSAPASHLELANKHLVDLIGKKAVFQGLKYEYNGINVIRFSVASEY